MGMVGDLPCEGHLTAPRLPIQQVGLTGQVELQLDPLQTPRLVKA